MKFNQLKEIQVLLALFMLSACSKQNDQTEPSRQNHPAEAPKQSQQVEAKANPSKQKPSISLRDVYTISLNGAAYLITELENTGEVGVTAFQGKWAIKDDLDSILADLEVRFTSDTTFVTPEGIKTSHVISPNEKFLIINQQVRGEGEKVFATTKENIEAVGIWTPAGETLTAVKLGDYRVKKKTTFAIEKIVAQ